MAKKVLLEPTPVTATLSEVFTVMGSRGTLIISRGGGVQQIELFTWKEVEFVISQLRHHRALQSAGKLSR